MAMSLNISYPTDALGEVGRSCAVQTAVGQNKSIYLASHSELLDKSMLAGFCINASLINITESLPHNCRRICLSCIHKTVHQDLPC